MRRLIYSYINGSSNILLEKRKSIDVFTIKALVNPSTYEIPWRRVMITVITVTQYVYNNVRQGVLEERFHLKI